MGGGGEPGLDGGEVTAEEKKVFHTCWFFKALLYFFVPPPPPANPLSEEASQRERQPGSGREATGRRSGR